MHIQLLSISLIPLLIATGISLDAPGWAIGTTIVLVIVSQLLLEARHARRTGGVCEVE